jgi:hypothetical protein
MTMRLRMCTADQERYGGPEWLDVDAAEDGLNDLDYDALKAIEDQVMPVFGVSLLRFVGKEFKEWTVPSIRGRLWLALRNAGVDVALADFKPKALSVEMQLRAPDADPPSGTPASSDTSTPTLEQTPTPESETSGSASTPGLPSTTG